MKYFALLTKLGENLLAQATALGTKIELTHMAVGDGGGSLPTPDTNQTKLIAEKRRAAINTLFIDDKNKNQIIAEQIIPEQDGGWWIREIGLFDKAGNLIAVANCPETYKPQLAEGSGRTQSIRMVLIVSHTESVTLKIDPSVVLATRDYVNESVKKSIAEHEKSRNHPDATTSTKGFVQLTDILSADNNKAITPKLATEINQRAVNAQASANAANTAATNANNNANSRVPATLKINNKPLSTDITLTAGDVSAYTKSESDTKFQPKGNYLPSGYSYSKSESDTKYQPKGNYAPAGDYATNTALKNGLASKADSKVFIAATDIGNSAISPPSGSASFVIDKNGGFYEYGASKGITFKVSADGVMTTGLIPVTCGGTNAKNSVDARKNLGALGVGDFGVGLTPATATNIASVDNIDRWDLAQGFYKVNTASKGERPTGGNGYKGFCLLVSVYGTAPGGAYVTQTAFYYSDANSETYRRSFDPITAAWTKWSKLYAEGNTYTDHNGNLKVSGSSSELSDYPVGAPIPWPQATAPSGYLICNGQSFNKTTYPLLAKAYPSGVLPDLRGEFLRGLDAGRGVDSGRAVLSAQGDMFKAHTHTVGGIYGGDSIGGKQRVQQVGTAQVSSSTGGNETRPRNIAFLYIVRAA
ncbi:phage tail-collar fiber domain-containing protein [Providencia stuartii]|uniref:phage tail-collar fiber domain-containing protein n=1 Tax=Providencia stuartii TaxID=588 RepID=UPI0034E501B2